MLRKFLKVKYLLSFLFLIIGLLANSSVAVVLVDISLVKIFQKNHLRFLFFDPLNKGKELKKYDKLKGSEEKIGNCKFIFYIDISGKKLPLLFYIYNDTYFKITDKVNDLKTYNEVYNQNDEVFFSEFEIVTSKSEAKSEDDKINVETLKVEGPEAKKSFYEMFPESTENDESGRIGERISSMFMLWSGWEQLPSKTNGDHGYDGLFIKGDGNNKLLPKICICECKCVNSKRSQKDKTTGKSTRVDAYKSVKSLTYAEKTLLNPIWLLKKFEEMCVNESTKSSAQRITDILKANAKVPCDLLALVVYKNSVQKIKIDEFDVMVYKSEKDLKDILPSEDEEEHKKLNVRIEKIKNMLDALKLFQGFDEKMRIVNAIEKYLNSKLAPEE